MMSGKKVLYFDCFSGISGDMACGAMADLTGVDDSGSWVVRALGLDHVEVKVDTRSSHGITGKCFEVFWNRREDVPRNFTQIVELLGCSSLPEEVIRNSREAFSLLARAESRIHGIPPEDVHFHEIGGIDSIVDIATFFFYLHRLGPVEIFCSELPSGWGSVETEHGTYPIPAPATLEVLKGTGAAMGRAEFEGEAVTPTGAALIASAGATFRQPQSFTVTATGYGVGQMDIPGRPNVLRVLEGKTRYSPSRDRTVVVETNVDDMNPQHVEILMERIFEMGALDFYITPVQMKKNRPGWLFTAITGEQGLEGVITAFFSITTTTGVRITDAKRVKLHRAIESVETSAGPVAVKVIEFPDGSRRAVPEYDDIKRIALERGVPVPHILEEVVRVWQKGK